MVAIVSPIAARSLAEALEDADIGFNTMSFGATANRQSHPFVDRQTEGPADINIVCVNAAELPAFAKEAGSEVFHGHYTIGVRFREVEDSPRWLHGSFNYFDEVWAASEFMRKTYATVSPKPVFKFPLPSSPDLPSGRASRKFGSARSAARSIALLEDLLDASEAGRHPADSTWAVSHWAAWGG